MLSCIVMIAGIVILAIGHYPWGSTREVRGAAARLVGFLIFITPLAFIIYGFQLGVEAARQGKEDPLEDDNLVQLVLIEIAVEAGVIGLCVLISFATAKPRKKLRRRRRYDEDYDDYDDRPRRRSRSDDYDDRPRYRDREDDYDDRPRRRERDDDDHEDEFDRRAR